MSDMNILDSILTLIYNILPLLFAFICLYVSLSFLKSARIMQDVPCSKIRSAAQGYVELSGTAKSLLTEPLPGLLSKKPCAWYSYNIEEFTTTRTETETTQYWQLLENGNSERPFVIEDGTGTCVILPLNAEILPTGAIVWRGPSRTPSLPPTSFLGWFFWNNWGQYRYTEKRIELDAPLYTCGMFYTLTQNDAPVRNNVYLNAYMNEKNITSLNILTKEGLSKTDDFIVSAITEARVIRQLKGKALLFFIAFLLFSFISFHSSYQLVKDSISHKAFKDFKW